METSTAAATITDGAVAGVLPELEAFAVHYPGYPTTVDRALETLGGVAAITKARSSEPSKSSEASRLELRFRPDDPYCHPAFGEFRPSAGLLLRLKKSGDDGGEAVKAEVVARVTSGYFFEGMADYQHVIPVHAAEARRKKRPWTRVDDGDKQESAKSSIIDMDQDDVMMLVPPLFAVKDKQEKLVLKPSANLFPKSIQKEVTMLSWEANIEPCLAIAFDIEKIPGKVDWEDKIPKNSVEWVWQDAVSKLFDERPIWTRRSIHDRLVDDGHQISENQIKRLLFRAGYYFSTGPFGKFWIKKGYDPRKDPDSRIYQRVDFRMPPQLRNLDGSASNAVSKQSWKDICQFKVWPAKIFVSLQLFELDDDFIQEEIKKPLNQAILRDATGWFPATVFRTLKLRVSMRFLSLCQKKVAENLLRSTKEHFERSRKAGVLGMPQKTQKDGQFAKKDSTDPMEASCMETNIHEHADLEGPDNSDIEEDEEELDGYDPNTACDDGIFAAADASYNTGESIPNDYLQELLRGFPFNSAAGVQEGDDLLGGNLSDGEYQILEQGSDDEEDYF